MLKSLTKGKWSRPPTDKSAVYLEFAPPGQQWGVRVTLMEHDARVEAINGPRGVWYRAPERYSSLVRPPHFMGTHPRYYAGKQDHRSGQRKTPCCPGGECPFTEPAPLNNWLGGSMLRL